MTGKTHLFIPDPHAHPDYNNDRAIWLGKLIKDIKPDVVINVGDMWDLPSMSSYDKGKASFHGNNYKRDLDAGLDFDDKLWSAVRKAKKKKPRRVFIEGNHEHRLKKALDLQPELNGLVSFKSFDLDRNYTDIVEYNGGTPGIINIDGIDYSHFFISGTMCKAVGGEHLGASLIKKRFVSSTCGHTHTLDWSVRNKPDGKPVMGLVGGVFQDYDSIWAGAANKLWWRGVVVKRNVEDGCYDPEFISIERLREVYGNEPKRA